jgi:hypothetical protein
VGENAILMGGCMNIHPKLAENQRENKPFLRFIRELRTWGLKKCGHAVPIRVYGEANPLRGTEHVHEYVVSYDGYPRL